MRFCDFLTMPPKVHLLQKAKQTPGIARFATLITPKGVHGIRRKAVWNCSPCERMESSRSDAWNQDRSRRIQPAADAIRGRAAMPYNSQSELIPYKALRSWIKQKPPKSVVFVFGGA